MCLGALVDAGVPIKKLENELKKILIKGYRFGTEEVKRAGFRATKVDVIQGARGKGQRAKKWKDIEKIISDSSLSNKVKQKGLEIFRRLFEAEAKVHGELFNTVHLHELGAVDCIVDIFGTIIGLEILGVKKVYTSSVNTGSGFIKTEHGTLPIPAPATTELLKGIPLYSAGTDFELTTPTGAVILKELSSSFGALPEMNIERIGIGAGNEDFKDRANVLRIFIGESSALSPQSSASTIIVIETNIDDMNPQIYEYLMERLLKEGALDVFLTQVIMKKGRPGVKLSVLCNSQKKDDLIKIIFTETTTIGLRFYEVQRKTLKRKLHESNTQLGKARFKCSMLENKIIRTTPEYDDCKRLAKKLKKPLLDVIERISYKKPG